MTHHLDSINIANQAVEQIPDSTVMTTSSAYSYELLSIRVDDLHNMVDLSYSSISAQLDALNVFIGFI